MRINCYGEETEALAYDKNIPRQPLETKVSDGATYMRFGDGDPCPVHRLTVGADGIVRREWAWGRWDGAEALAYVPATETMEVQT